MTRKSFHQKIIQELNAFLQEQKKRFPVKDTLTIDLHCHDHNSSVPDELLGRILGIPETWLATDDLLAILQKQGCNSYTITNHNNARSCFELQDQGIDILVGAEFSCKVPDYDAGIHVLAYGFTPAQEARLNKLRSDIYKFQDYTKEQDIPTIWAHPLFHYRKKGMPSIDFFDKMALLFNRFEVINGQRDSWQNILIVEWVKTLTPENIAIISKKYGIAPTDYCRDPHLKAMAGGSDAHMGIFSGLSGTRLYVPDLHTKLTAYTKSYLTLEAIKKGDMAPFGSHNDSEKMTIAFLDYFCQIGIHMQDPGLMRMLLHKGDAKYKILAFTIANGFAELKRHKITSSFLKIFHDCFSGKVPFRAKRFFVPKTYKKIFNEASNMAATKRDRPEKTVPVFNKALHTIYKELNTILISRLSAKFENFGKNHHITNSDLEHLIENFEIPSHLRDLFEHNPADQLSHMSTININELLDGLSFPFLASIVILASFYTSTKVLYNTRPLLKKFAIHLDHHQYPERMLWLTDTFEDNNGVSLVLKSMLKEIQERDLPIDILVCSNTLKEQDHLIVVPCLSEFTLPFYKQQPFRIPNMLDIHKIFKEGEYDRIMCSTEGVMGLVSLFLKNAYTVPAYFYVHTDWMMFANKVLNFNHHQRSRMRRLLRFFYHGFDGLFVLNTDQKKWLTSSAMGFSPSQVFLTAHWADKYFQPQKVNKMKLFKLKKELPVLLFAGRISAEKGVNDIPYIYKKVRASHPDLTIVFAGTGPEEEKLRQELPDAIFLGWVPHTELPDVFSAADLLLLPSKFDTFGCVVLEALQCGLPVVAYSTKGPKDIIEHNKNGMLVASKTEMVTAINDYFSSMDQAKMKKAAYNRALAYQAETIIPPLLRQVGLQPDCHETMYESVAQ